MKKITTQSGKFGPYSTIETLEDRYRVDDAELSFSVIGQGVISEVVDGDFPPIVIPPNYDAMAADIRTQRNALLLASDWTQIPDYPGADKQTWATYRQALRDITKQSGFPFTVNWPTASTN